MFGEDGDAGVVVGGGGGGLCKRCELTFLSLKQDSLGRMMGTTVVMEVVVEVVSVVGMSMGGGGADNGRDAVVSSGGDAGKAGRGAGWRDCCRFPTISRELRRPPMQSPIHVQCW